MSLDKSQIYRGKFLTASGSTVIDQPPPRRGRDELRRQFPQFEAVLEQAGSSPEEQRLAEAAAENRRIEARVAEIKAKVEAFRKATGRT